VAASLDAQSAESWTMPALTRRQYHEAQDECWHVYYGGVRVGTIAKRIGVPPDEDPWGWACGFYPGCHPRDGSGLF
jgi:cephalosporin-C deacetylase-like acetyl esterase